MITAFLFLVSILMIILKMCGVLLLSWISCLIPAIGAFLMLVVFLSLFKIFHGGSLF